MSKAQDVIRKNRERNERNDASPKHPVARGVLEASFELFIIGLLFGGVGLAIVLPFVGIPLVALIIAGYFIIKAITK